MAEPAAPERDAADPPVDLDALSRLLAANADRYDREGVFPADNMAHVRQAGLVALTVRAPAGGAGAGMAAAARILAPIAEGDPSTALILAMTYGFGLKTRRLPPAEQAAADRVLRDIAAKGVLLGELRVEPDLGTPSRGGLPATTATRTAGGWRISGRKTYATGSTGLGWCSVMARTDEDPVRVGRFLVPADAPGVTVEESWDHIGMRATVSHDMRFHDVPVPADHVIGLAAPGAADETPDDRAGAIWNVLSIAIIYNAIFAAAHDWLRGYLKGRTPSNLGRPLATLPRMQEGFGEAEALLAIDRRLIADAVARADRLDDGALLAAEAAKYHATNNAIRGIGLGLELTGNPGLSRRNPLERHYRNALCGRVHSPQNDSLLQRIGRLAFDA